jgi:hypothetical protein
MQPTLNYILIASKLSTLSNLAERTRPGRPMGAGEHDVPDSPSAVQIRKRRKTGPFMERSPNYAGSCYFRCDNRVAGLSETMDKHSRDLPSDGVVSRVRRSYGSVG